MTGVSDGCQGLQSSKWHTATDSWEAIGNPPTGRKAGRRRKWGGLQLLCCVSTVVIFSAITTNTHLSGQVEQSALLCHTALPCIIHHYIQQTDATFAAKYQQGAGGITACLGI